MKGQHHAALCNEEHKYHFEGNPDRKDISTSFVESGNLSMRMGHRRIIQDQDQK
jgi:hypothetical protein